MTPVTKINLTPGEVLYRQGDGHETGFIIASGEVILFRETDGKRHNIERRGPGAILGELSVLKRQPRAATVKAVTECTLYRISAEQILHRFDGLDPLLRACVDTSINFASTLSTNAYDNDDEVPLQPDTLPQLALMIEQFDLEMDVLEGISGKEFFMVFQPIISIETSQIVGLEALMRWIHPTRGFVPPDIFIQAAENMGAIEELTNYAIMESCAALRRIKDQDGAPEQLFVSINVSGTDICRSNFVDFLTHAVDLHDLQPEEIKIEITETAVVDDFETADHTFNRLRALGFGISIDDFGTGYSNLTYLKSMPLTTIKIDRAFAGDAHANKVSRGIVRMLLALGKELGIDIIAEGLETIDDVKTLRALGCLYAQGYFYHKPLPEADIVPLLTGQAPKLQVA